MHKNICLLLTATINPINVPFLKRKDLTLREKDYLDSMKKWLRHKDINIIFCENSGYDLFKFKKVIEESNHNYVELLSFNGNDEAKIYGKSYCELTLMEYAIKNSIFLKNCDFIFKCTGRNYVKNFSSILKWKKKNNDIFILVNLGKFLKQSDSRFFGFRLDFFYKYLIKYKSFIDDNRGFFIEHAISRSTLEAIIDGNNWSPLPYWPRYEGTSGTFNISIRQNFFKFLKSSLRHKIYRYLIAK